MGDSYAKFQHSFANGYGAIVKKPSGGGTNPPRQIIKNLFVLPYADIDMMFKACLLGEGNWSIYLPLDQLHLRFLMLDTFVHRRWNRGEGTGASCLHG